MLNHTQKIALVIVAVLCFLSFSTTADAGRSQRIYDTTPGIVLPSSSFYVLDQDQTFLICLASDEQDDINKDTLFTCDDSSYTTPDGIVVGPDSRGKFGFPEA